MPPDPTDPAILARRTTPHQRLVDALSIEAWPLPLSLLPPGSALVGGAVRDGLLGRLRERPDLDLVVPGDGLAMSRRLARELGGTAVVLDPERSIGRLVLQGWTIDLARQRGDTLVEDLARRDFTINALAVALPLAGQPLALVDPLGGMEDLRQRRLRAIAEANLLDDPLRLLRGPRLAAELGFTMTPETWDWTVRHRARLGSVAGERVLAELLRLVEADDGARGVDLLVRGGLLDSWIAPSASSAPAAFAVAHPSPLLPPATHLTPEAARLRGLTEAEARSALPIARLAALLDESTLRALRASNKLRSRCRQLRRWRQRLVALDRADQGLGGLPEAEQLELHRQLEGDLPALLLDLTPSQAAAALRRWRDPEDPLFHPRPPVDGLELQKALGLPPGPRLGRLLDHLMRERAFGRLPRHDPADSRTLQLARRWIAATADSLP
ncbi:MAG: CCA tRNA nucleotidyltransferase [Cyanobacteria bacterium K_Offshore_surface_m2_239]|nr:CCA tRNA nucleotidyltransferase [Cyanobacteria bacterium K_Offshore_surface_m2_239]